MAGSIISMPANGDSDWSNFVTIVEKTYRGYIGISLSNLSGSAVPAIQDGSIIEVNGTIFQFTTAETITGWPSAGGTTLYMTVVPAGTTCTATFTASAPTWSGTKNGWYDSNDRYFGELTWGGSATYNDKIIYQRFNDNNDKILITGDGGVQAGSAGADGPLFIKSRMYEIGDWNMDGTAGIAVDVSVDVGFAQRRGVRGMIIDDGESHTYPIPCATQSPLGTTILDLYWDVSGTAGVIRVSRRDGGLFDTVGFNATSFNRGWIIVDYE